MGKAKYISVRKANKNKSKVPNFIPYATLAEYINNIDIGVIKDVQSEFGSRLEDNETGQGMCRQFDEYVLRLATFYLYINENRVDKLKTFPHLPKKDTKSFLFVMAVGGDGAPSSGTVFLVSFLNVATRLASSSENFLVFGANVPENSNVVRRYVLKLVSDIQFLESKPFDVNVNGKITKVEFMLGELPNDMKMLCFLGGELSNAAHYFSTFADVNKSNCNDIKKVGFGKNDWKPFSYDERVKDAKKALEKSKELAKSKSSKQTKRTNLTTYIRQVLKSRQEEKPLVSKYIERAKSEPLHRKNNVVKELFNKLLQVCVFHNPDCRISNLSMISLMMFCLPSLFHLYALRWVVIICQPKLCSGIMRVVVIWKQV